MPLQSSAVFVQYLDNPGLLGLPVSHRLPNLRGLREAVQYKTAPGAAFVRHRDQSHSWAAWVVRVALVPCWVA